MKNQNLTKQQIEHIKNYGNEIHTIDSFVEAVRKMPGMYIGHTGIRGMINMFREVLQNSIDEMMRKNSPCDTIIVTYDESTSTIIVEDNGKGIPFGNIVRIFTEQHTSSNYSKEEFNYTSGVHGMGAKVTNALSTKFIVESYILGDARRVEFDEGIPWNKGDKKTKELKIPNPDNRQGTMVCFTPSYEIMGDIRCTYEPILNLIRALSPLTNVGSVIHFKAITTKGKEVVTSVVNEDGIMSFIIDSTTSPIIKPISYSRDIGKMRANIMFTYDSDIVESEAIYSFANFSPTDTRESSHVKGFIAGIRRYFTGYMNRIYLNTGSGRPRGKKKKKLTIVESDIRTGLRVVLDVAHISPLFTGQSKDVLSVDAIEEFVRDLTMESLDQWSKDNPGDLQKICKYFKDIAEIRLKSDEGRVRLVNQYPSSINGKPVNYTEPVLMGKVKPSDDVKFEIYIVEGESAGGSIKTNRDNNVQGLMPLRGKMINCFEHPLDKCLKNAEVAGLIAIIDAGYGKSFDINKVVWDKIVLAMDADADGDHIAALVIRFILRFFPELITAGKVYRAVPPLFSVGKGNSAKYFTTRADYVQHIQKEFSKKFKISTAKNNKLLTSREVMELLYNNIDYIYELRKIGDRYKIEYKLLELYLFNRNESVETIGKLIKKEYRFMEIKSINETPTAEGIINDKYNTLFMNKRLVEDSDNIIDIIDNNIYLHYNMNGKLCSLYDIMSAYEASEPASITRYKGLGQMAGKDLGSTTVLPASQGGERLLIKYTMDNITEDINRIRYLESNKHKLLEGLNVTRMDVLD